jgi:hypothetical protein
MRVNSVDPGYTATDLNQLSNRLHSNSRVE